MGRGTAGCAAPGYRRSAYRHSRYSGRSGISQPLAIPGGPAAYWSALPITGIVSALVDAGVPAAASSDAGGFVCNHLFYGLMHLIATERPDLEIYDRVGGGDSFASGLIYGFLAGHEPQWAVECGAAHGALAMTTPGDTTMVTLKEVTQVMKGVGARIAR